MNLTRNLAVLVVGALLLGVNLLLLAPMATGGVQAAVDDGLATKPKDDACANDDCTEMNEEWRTSTSRRDYYAWNLTNPEVATSNPSAAEYEKVGPVTYEITSTRTILSYDAVAGTLTYSESKSYDWYAGWPSDTAVTGLNILFEPQRIGGTSLAMNSVYGAAVEGFAVEQLDNDMNNTQASIRTAADTQAAIDSMGEEAWINAAHDAWAASPTGVGVLNVNELDDNELPDAEFPDGLDSALHSTFHPSDSNFNISLLSQDGALAFTGMGSPDLLVSAIESDNLNSTTIQRANTYGYLAVNVIDADGDTIPETVVPDVPQTLVRDWALYSAIAGTFQSHGGGGGPDGVHWSQEPATFNARLSNLTGVNMSGADLDGLLLGGHTTDSPTGILASDSSGSSFGVSEFTGLSALIAMNDYNLTAEQYAAVAEWVGAWLDGTSSMQLAFVGGVGTMNATEYALTVFGNEEPFTGDFVTTSLNLGGIWGSGAMSAYGSTGDVRLSAAQMENILFGPMGLTGDACVMFLYGEMTGHTVPLDPSTMLPNASGIEIPWGDSTVAEIYGIDNNSAAALRYFIKNIMFSTNVPILLEEMFGYEATGYQAATKYVTHTVDEWLFGWRDPLMAMLGGDVNDLTLGWQSLETNSTFYGSNGVSTGEPSTYTICTGENSSCDKAEILKQDGLSQLGWRTDASELATYGGVSAVSLAGTTGGFVTGDGDLLNMGDYAVVPLTHVGSDAYYDIPTQTWTASADASDTSIQAKLVPDDSVLDIFPGAVPIYFGGDVTVQVEPTSNLIISGESTSRFYLDTRHMSQQSEPPTERDLVPVFEIRTSGGASESQMKDMHSQIIQNQDSGDYWKNFDHWADYLTLLLYIGAGVGIFGGIGLFANDSLGARENEIGGEESDDEAADSSTPAVTAPGDEWTDVGEDSAGGLAISDGPDMGTF